MVSGPTARRSARCWARCASPRYASPATLPPRATSAPPGEDVCLHPGGQEVEGPAQGVGVQTGLVRAFDVHQSLTVRPATLMPYVPSPPLATPYRAGSIVATRGAGARQPGPSYIRRR